MTILCPYCGAPNSMAEADREQHHCVACGQPVNTTAESDPPIARKIVIALIILFIAIAAVLFLNPTKSPKVQSARRTLFGAPISARFGAGREGGSSGEGSSLPDAEATGEPHGKDEPIGRLPDQFGPRKPGDEIRPGAAGTDEPAPNNQVGNSKRGMITNAPSAGGNPANSDARNSVETPSGSALRIGSGSGDEPSAAFPSRSTNAADTNQSHALLLDDFSERLRQAGARSGDVQISLEWKNVNDLDLHVIDPNGEEIFYNHRQSRAGGKLDVDMNASQLTTRPVENVYWPEQGAARGAYRVDVVHFANHGAPDPTLFTVRVVVKGRPSYYRGYISYVPSTTHARVTVCTFTVQ